MSTIFCHNPNINLFRGAAHGVALSRHFLPQPTKIYGNLLGIAQVCHDFVHFATPAETCQAIYFVQLCKKYLTIVSELHYNRRRAFKNNLHKCRKKFLTIPGVARILPGWARGLAQRLHVLKKILPTPAKKT